MNIALLATLLSALAWLPGLYMIGDALKKRRALKARAEVNDERVVVRSALELLQPYQTRVRDLEDQLAATTAKMSALTLQLSAATRRASDLADKLESAQTEVAFLRLQVKSMSAQLSDEHRPEGGVTGG